MKKTIIAATLVAFITSASVAQKLRTYAKLVYVKTQTETPDVTVYIENAVANDKQLKFKLKIVNKTNDYVIFKPSESKLIVNGKEWKPGIKEKELVISPLESDFRVMNTLLCRQACHLLSQALLCLQELKKQQLILTLSCACVWVKQIK